MAPTPRQISIQGLRPCLSERYPTKDDAMAVPRYAVMGKKYVAPENPSGAVDAKESCGKTRIRIVYTPEKENGFVISNKVNVAEKEIVIVNKGVLLFCFVLFACILLSHRMIPGQHQKGKIWL